MITITLPDGSKRQFDQPVTVFGVAESIGAGLAKAALAGRLNDKLVDTDTLIASDAKLSIITEKDPEGLEIIRHSCAHLLAQAVKSIYPQVQVTIGPVIEDGFYYDFAFERTFTPEDVDKIEAKMLEIAKENLQVSHKEISRNEAIEYFKGIGENYKAEIISDLPEDEVLTIYQQGDFIDLCRGPHVPSTGRLNAFKITKLAGAYWRGDSNNEMLQRIYGTAWQDKKALKAYLHRIEEAEKRDHRRIAKQMDLFHVQEIAPGMVFWHDNGWTLYQTIESYLRKLLREKDYQEIRTPQVVDAKLWHASGHWDMYREHMLITESEKHQFAIKPMSCPCHVQVFNHSLKSYRDLPIRMAEFGNCHRNEHSGTLHGLMRVRNFVQDDAHIFCTHDQIQEEALSFIQFLQQVYADFGFEEVIVRLSTRPDKRVGDDALWDRAESDLKHAIEASGLEWTEQPGEGAFYGPKIDFSLKDCLGRVWQLGTLQLDYCLPVRLGAEYVAEDGSRQPPVMLHRAILGSFERFIGILIEHFSGKFPVWLAPIQVVVMNITDRQAEYVSKITKNLQKQGIRAINDLRNEKIGYKIREHTLQRVPYQLIIGDKELEDQTVSVRTREGTDLGAMRMNEFTALVINQVNTKMLTLEEKVTDCEKEASTK
ncbi:MAG: threonine--tRNA ligase [Gammaproteobacteria bacterium]